MPWASAGGCASRGTLPGRASRCRWKPPTRICSAAVVAATARCIRKGSGVTTPGAPRVARAPGETDMAARRQPFHAPAADSLAGRVILVTGGGRGLGAAICASLARAGASVAVGDIDEDSARAVCERLPGGEEPLALPLDVRDERSARSAMREVVGRHGHIDALVNNAGVDVTKPVSGLSLDEWDRILAVNLRGPFLLSKLAFAEMQRRGNGGHIVNICSTAA